MDSVEQELSAGQVLALLVNYVEAVERHLEADAAIGAAIYRAGFATSEGEEVRARYGDTETPMHTLEDELCALSPTHLRALAARAEVMG